MKFTTSVGILGVLSLIFGVDAILAYIHGSVKCLDNATFSEVTTNYIFIHPLGFATLFFGLGVLAYHFLDKLLYK